MKNLESFLEEVEGMKREEFLARFRHPFLINSRASLREARSFTPDQSKSKSPKKSGFATQSVDRGNQIYLSLWVYQGWVLPLVKGDSGQRQMINLGRTENNDIIIPLPIVSKFHCCFIVSPDGIHLLEGGSTNGTRVNGVILGEERGEKVLLNDGDLITLGNRLEFEYFTPSSLWEALGDYQLIARMKNH